MSDSDVGYQTPVELERQLPTNQLQLQERKETKGGPDKGVKGMESSKHKRILKDFSPDHNYTEGLLQDYDQNDNQPVNKKLKLK